MSDFRYPSRALNNTTDSVSAVQSGTWTVTVASSGMNSRLVYTNNYSSVNLTTSAYLQVVASTTNTINRLYISDTSGSFIILAVGAAGSEVDRLYIGPGGNDNPFELNIPIGSRISIKALDTNATQGRIVITALG